MSNTATKIEWCDTTWNPVTGCTKVSDGCKNCYAERVFNRMAANPKTPAYHGRKFTDVQCHEDRLAEPLHWKKPRRVFVNSMSDLFHESVPDHFINKVFTVMLVCPQHTFQILTKRVLRMLAFIAGGKHPYQASLGPNVPAQNVWLGVSIEDQETADERIPILLQTPAAVRFVSYEPALGPVTFRPRAGNTEEILRAHMMDDLKYYQSPAMLNGIDWVIAGGESGPNARPSHPEWFRSVRDQCQASRVPFFFKQWGEYMPLEDWRKRPSDPEGPTITYMPQERISWMGAEPIESCKAEILMAVCRVGKQCAGRLLDGREWNEFPEGRLEC